MTRIVQTNSVNQTRQLAAELARRLSLPAVVALTGRLGAGKTHFVKGLGEALGIDPAKICSATFVIIAEYGDEKHLVHIDAYRLDSPRDLENIGWSELLEQDDVLIAIEWADKIAAILPENRLDVHIDILDNHRRQFTITPHGSLYTSAMERFSLHP